MYKNRVPVVVKNVHNSIGEGMQQCLTQPVISGFLAVSEVLNLMI